MTEHSDTEPSVVAPRAPEMVPPAPGGGRWKALLLGVLVVVGLFLWAVPPALEFAIARWFESQGADQVRVGKVRLDLIAGRVGIYGLHVREEGHPALSVAELSADIDWRPLFERRVQLREVRLAGASVVAQLPEEGPVRVGVRLPQPESTPGKQEAGGEPWGVGIAVLRVNGSRFRLETADLDADWQVDDLNLRDLATWKPGEDLRFSLDSRFNGSPLEVSGLADLFSETRRLAVEVAISDLALAPFSVFAGDAVKALRGRLSADLRVELETGGGSLRVVPEGELGVSALLLEDAGGNRVRGNLQWNGRIATDVGTEGQVKVAADGRLDGVRFEIAAKEAGLDAGVESLTWEGGARIGVTGPSTEVTVAGGLELEGVGMRRERHEARVASAGWKGDLGLGLGGETPRIDARGDLQAAGIGVSDLAAGMRLVEAKSAVLGGIVAGGTDEVRVSSVIVTQALALGPLSAPETGTESARPAEPDDDAGKSEPGQMFRADSLTVADLGLSGRELTVGGVQVAAALLDLQRGEDGSWAYLRALEQEPVAAGEAPAEPAPTAGSANESADGETVVDAAATAPEAEPEPMRVRIARAALTEQSRVRFADASVTPRFRTELVIEEARIENYDSGDPDAKSTFQLRAKLDGQGKIESSGHLFLNRDPLSGQIVTNVHNIEMPPLTPYSVPTIGYALNTGQLDVESEVTIDAGKLDGDNEIKIRKLELTKKNASRAEELAAQITMPLNSALGLLRDKRGNIKLDLPVSGDLQNPDISVQDAINTALGKAMRKAAFSYVKYALQPYGTLITLAEVATEAGKKLALRLEPIRFTEGNADLGDEARGYVERIAGLMKERPDMRVTLCGTATEADRAALQAAGKPFEGETPVLDLASARAGAVREILAGRGVPADRLFSCNPKLETGSDAGPMVRVEI